MLLDKKKVHDTAENRKNCAKKKERGIAFEREKTKMTDRNFCNESCEKMEKNLRMTAKVVYNFYVLCYTICALEDILQ